MSGGTGYYGGQFTPRQDNSIPIKTVHLCFIPFTNDVINNIAIIIHVISFDGVVGDGSASFGGLQL